MKYDLIKAYDYLLVVSDEEIKEGDWFITDDGRIEISAPDWKAREWHRKIIAHLPPNNSSILEGVDLLPPLPQGDDVEKLSENFLKDLQVASTSVNRSVKLGFEVGYNIAKETYKYTEDDIQKAFIAGEERIINKPNSSELDDFTNFIQSLQQQPKLPIAFECDIDVNCNGNENKGCFMDSPGHDCGCVSLKTITNSQGQTEWVGKYIYN